jgi:hypothetical protein
MRVEHPVYNNVYMWPCAGQAPVTVRMDIQTLVHHSVNMASSVAYHGPLLSKAVHGPPAP